MFILWWTPYDDFLCHWFYCLSKAVFHNFSKWFPIHKNIKLNFLLASARPWPRPDLLAQLSPGSHLVHSAISTSLSHSALSLTDMSLALSSEWIPLLNLSLRPPPPWVLTGPEELPHVTLSEVKCYMTFKPIFIIWVAALTLKKNYDFSRQNVWKPLEIVNLSTTFLFWKVSS